MLGDTPMFVIGGEREWRGREEAINGDGKVES